MIKPVNISTTNLRHVLSVGLAGATLAVVLAYTLAGQTLLQTAQAETGHNLFMSLIQGIVNHASSASQSPLHGIAENNMLGGPASLPAGGLAAVVATSAVALAAGAFVVSWKQRSFVMAGLLTASGIIIMIPALVATDYFAVIVFPGPIVGFIFGLVISGLGVVKGIETRRTMAKNAVT